MTTQIGGGTMRCSLDNSICEPLLYVYVGRLEDAMALGTNLPNFWCTESGGRFKLDVHSSCSPPSTPAEESYSMSYKDARDLVKHNDETVRSKVAVWVGNMQKGLDLNKKRAELERQKAALEKQIAALDK